MPTTLFCPSCTDSNPGDAQFCIACGAALRRATLGTTIALTPPAEALPNESTILSDKLAERFWKGFRYFCFGFAALILTIWLALGVAEYYVSNIPAPQAAVPPLVPLVNFGFPPDPSVKLHNGMPVLQFFVIWIDYVNDRKINEAMLMIGEKPSKRLLAFLDEPPSRVNTWGAELTDFSQKESTIYAKIIVNYHALNKKIQYDVELHYEEDNWKLVDIETTSNAP